MGWMRWGRGVALAGLLASTGCCWWCDRMCPRPAAYQGCAPVCCSAAPAYVPATAYSGPPPAAVPAWSNPPPAQPVSQGRATLVYNPGTGCYCEQR